MIHVWHWILDFIGVNNTYDSFSTHMYNFWSGFGGNISILALLGATFGLYRQHVKNSKALNLINRELAEKLPHPIQHHEHKHDHDSDQDS